MFQYYIHFPIFLANTNPFCFKETSTTQRGKPKLKIREIVLKPKFEGQSKIQGIKSVLNINN